MDDVDSSDLQWKTFFLGPKSENANWLLKNVQDVMHHWVDWRKSRFPGDGPAISYQEQADLIFRQRQKAITAMVVELAEKFESETPKYSPRYIGHMVSEVSMTALLGHIVCLLHNPNNASKEASRVGSLLEEEAVQLLAEMVGYDSGVATGHFTSGGTVANFEALWRARYRMDHWLALGIYLKKNKLTKQSIFNLAHLGWNEYDALCKEFSVDEEDLKQYSFVLQGPWQIGEIYSQLFQEVFPQPVVLVPENKHYSWPKGVSLLGLGQKSLVPVQLDEHGRMSIDHLRASLDDAIKSKRPVMMVTSVAGTTELGVIDPVHKVSALLEEYREQHGLHFWHHVDAAYGGFYCCLGGASKTRMNEDGRLAMDAIRTSESVTIDPHKLGYVPYASGSILLRDQRSNIVSSFPAPYLIKGKGNEGLWSSTLEGSRSAAGITATWLTAKSIGLHPEGYGRILETGLIARDRLESLLKRAFGDLCQITPSDSNILCFCLAERGESVSTVNQRSLDLYDALETGPNFNVSKTHLGRDQYDSLFKQMVGSWSGATDTDHLVLIRTVLMNPFVLVRTGTTDLLQDFVNELLGLLKKS